MNSFKRILFKNWVSFTIALVSFIGGLIWISIDGFQTEAMILIIISIIQILGFIFIKEELASSPKPLSIKTPEVQVSNQDHKGKPDIHLVVDSKKNKIRILFIDDDTKFNVVKILKDSGWRFTKSTQDIKSLDLSIVKDSDIIFVDINGVGKLLKLEFEGLDLALMLKQKYQHKKIVIYSAKKDTNAFHPVWDIIDGRIEKNALPYQFQHLVEKFSIEF